MNIRHATDDDCIAFYRWWSEKETQRFVGTPTFRLDFDAHVKWFVANFSNPFWFVGEIDGVGHERIGACRIEPDASGVPWISIVLAPEHRGRGYGQTLIAETTGRYHSAEPSGPVFARIHRYNAPSIGAFARAGYVFDRDSGPWKVYRKDGAE